VVVGSIPGHPWKQFFNPGKKINKALSVRVIVICSGHKLLWRDSYKGVDRASILPESILHKIIIIIIIAGHPLFDHQVKSIFQPLRVKTLSLERILAMFCMLSWLAIFCCLFSCCIWFRHLKGNKSIFIPHLHFALLGEATPTESEARLLHA